MNIIALIDTRPELPGETIGTVISTHGTMAARTQSERGISKPDASQRGKVSHPHENRHSESTARRRRTRSIRALVSGGGKVRAEESVMKSSNDYDLLGSARQ
jgi:hypothetical protein